MTPVVIVSTVAAVGWILAAAFAGLYWGERGRRIDAQYRETGKPRLPGKPEKAAVTQDRGGEGSHIPDEQTENEIREKLIAQGVDEGYPRELVEQDVDNMLSQMKKGSPTGAPTW